MLRTLDLSFCPLLTDIEGFQHQGPIASLNQRGNLTCVNLTGCPRLKDADIEPLSGPGRHHEWRITHDTHTNQLTSDHHSTHRVNYLEAHHDYVLAAGIQMKF